MESKGGRVAGKKAEIKGSRAKMVAGRLGLAALVVVTVGVSVFVGFAAGRAQSAAAIANAPEEDRQALALYAEALLTAREEYVDREAADPTIMTHGAIEGMLGALGDGGHTRYLSEREMEETREGLSGEYVGVGVQLEEQDDGDVAILSPLAGSPAERAGLRSGDVVEAVDGWDAGNGSVEEVVARIKGREGSSVDLEVARMDGQGDEGARVRSFGLRRETIDAPAASWAMLGDAAPDAGSGERTAVVALSSFSEDAASELAEAFEDAERAGAARYVLDLRGNPGGELEEAVFSAGLFLEAGRTVYVREDANGDREKVEAADPAALAGGDGPRVTAPVVVLVDGASASSSEILAGALKDNDRARVVGETTAGTGTVLSEFPLKDGSSMLLGVAEWLTPAGDFIRESGIEPNVQARLGDDQRPLLADEARGLSAAEISREDAQLAGALGELRKKGAR